MTQTPENSLKELRSRRNVNHLAELMMQFAGCGVIGMAVATTVSTLHAPEAPDTNKLVEIGMEVGVAVYSFSRAGSAGRSADVIDAEILRREAIGASPTDTKLPSLQ